VTDYQAQVGHRIRAVIEGKVVRRFLDGTPGFEIETGQLFHDDPGNGIVSITRINDQCPSGLCLVDRQLRCALSERHIGEHTAIDRGTLFSWRRVTEETS
jgi:hypothetical protein